MKKLIVIILVLVIIFIGMIVYKNQSTKINSSISVQEVKEIETYITKIYMWKEVTNQALPIFDNINSASDIWIWEVVKKNLEDYELSYEQIEEKSKELFGSDFNKNFPKEGMEYFIYDEQKGKYYPQGRGLDQKEDCFLLNKIEKKESTYEVEIIEYLEDYSALANKGNIIIENTKEEFIDEIGEEEEERTKEIVKNNVDKFSKKKLILEKDLKKQKFFIKKVEEV